MSGQAIGLDIGGTKIAGAVFDADGRRVAQAIKPTPHDYTGFLEACLAVVTELRQFGSAVPIGIGTPDMRANMNFLVGTSWAEELTRMLGGRVVIGNDANCAALAEAIEGAGRGYRSVAGLILGTGVGIGFIYEGRIIQGANGIIGEIGHLPLPFYEADDGPQIICNCGQKGCIDKTISGGGLARLYQHMTGMEASAAEVAALAAHDDAQAGRVLDRFYTIVAKAMVVIMHSFDPDIIVVSGGLSDLAGLYKTVPQRWERYMFAKSLKTKLVPANYGPMAGLRGAALQVMAAPVGHEG